MGMTHCTSGKMGYELRDTRHKWMFTHEELIRVLKVEEELRFSKAWQDRYSERDTLKHFAEVTRLIQLCALTLAGFEADDRTLEVFQSARARLTKELKTSSDPDTLRSILDIPVYHRMDFSSAGDLVVGSPFPNCKLYSLAEEEGLGLEAFTTPKTVNLHDLVTRPDRPLVIYAGSAT